MNREMIVQLEAKQAFIPYIPCAECRELFNPNRMHFAVEHGHAVHRCFPCADRVGVLHSLEASDRSAEEEQTLFNEMIESDPTQIAHFVRDRFGGGQVGLKVYSDLLVSQVLVTAALKPGSKNVLDGLKFIHSIFVAGAADRRAEQDLSRKSDEELDRLALELLTKARVVKDVNSSVPALAAPDRPLSASTGGTGEVAGVVEGAAREATGEPQPVRAPA